jgi:hypothetical protein
MTEEKYIPAPEIAAIMARSVPDNIYNGSLRNWRKTSIDMILYYVPVMDAETLARARRTLGSLGHR